MKLPKEIQKNSLLAFCESYNYITSPDKWTPEKLHFKICKLIQDAIENQKKIIISVPPQHGKSIIASVYSTIWYLLKYPKRSVAVVSYGSDLAESKSIEARNLAKEAIDPNLSKEVKSKKNWALSDSNTINFRARSVAGGITGARIDYLVLDDLIKNHKEAESKTYRDNLWSFVQSTLTTRLSKYGCVVAILTRWHTNDYASKLHEEWGWPLYNFPAICENPENDLLGRKLGEVACPILQPKEKILDDKKKLSDYVWASLYKGNPSERENSRIQRKWFKYYDEDISKEIAQKYNVYQVVDTAGTENETSDYFVCLTWAIVTSTVDGDIILTEQEVDRATKDNKELFKNIYILDILRKKLETTKHEETLKEQRSKWKPITQYVESAIFGLVIIQHAKKAGLPIEAVIADKSKFLRSEQIAVYYRNGRVFHPKNAKWLEIFEDEIINFGISEYDDQFDAVSYAGIITAKKVNL